jgi:predicted metal-dependent phosphotriesterase family hydrolase
VRGFEARAYLKTLCDRGSFVGMDRFGIDIFLEGDKRAASAS